MQKRKLKKKLVLYQFFTNKTGKALARLNKKKRIKKKERKKELKTQIANIRNESRDISTYFPKMKRVIILYIRFLYQEPIRQPR